MSNFIVTNKDVVMKEIHPFWDSEYTEVRFDDFLVMGKKQLAKIIEKEVKHRLMQKYLAQEIEAVLKDLVLIKIKPEKAKRLFKSVEFI